MNESITAAINICHVTMSILKFPIHESNVVSNVAAIIDLF